MYLLRQDRQLTEKGKMMFEDICTKERQTCGFLWNTVEDFLINLPETNDVKGLRQLDNDIDKAFADFCNRSEEYRQFLVRQGTSEANVELKSLTKNFEKCRSILMKARNDIRDRKLDLVESISQTSQCSRAGSTASQKRAKAEAERVKLDFVKKESELINQKAEIEANINIILQEAKVDAADVEASFLEEKEDVCDPRLPVSDKNKILNGSLKIRKTSHHNLV